MLMKTFKDLLDKDALSQLKSSQSPKPKPRMTPKSAPDERTLFMQAMRGVTPLQSTPTITKPVQKDPNAAFRRAAAQGAEESVSVVLSDMQALLNPVDGEAFLTYKNPTLPNKTFEQLRQGKLRWYDVVDLHSANIDEARTVVVSLIERAQKEGETVVKIVHGKGDALIKTCVNGWLKQINTVLAFVSAPPKDGGTGAVLVLLKRSTI